jgi:beta-galactosidase
MLVALLGILGAGAAAAAASSSAGTPPVRSASPAAARVPPPASIFPGRSWARVAPADVGLNESKLEAFRSFIGPDSHGVVVRYGRIAYSWGAYTERHDVASAVKPTFAHFLMVALERGFIGSVDDPVVEWEPRLATLNADLGYKDRNITWRHMANQISCYEIEALPGTAFDYNDWQMELFFQTLTLKAFGRGLRGKGKQLSLEEANAELLQGMLAEPIGCEDGPTWLYYGNKSSIGRLGISNRDFARIGLLYLNGGEWAGKRLISEKHAKLLTSNPVPLSLPRAGDGGTSGAAAEIIPGIGTLGSTKQPDNQVPHNGSYSWTWWVNKEQKTGKLFRPTAPPDLYGAFGDGRYGPSTMSVLPTQEIVVSWNHAVWNHINVSKENEAFALLMDAVSTPMAPTEARLPRRRSFTECGQRLCKDGAPFTVAAGSLHFWRSHPAEWPRRLHLLRQAGFNTVSTYLPWNLLEPQPGEFVDRDTHPELDFVAFVHEADAAGLLVSIRAGPYITAEHDFGGYPWWLISHSNESSVENRSSTFRTTASWFTSLVDRYWDNVIPPLSQLIYSNGGPIVSFQIDDDTSGIGSECNTSMPDCKYFGYLPFLRDGLHKRGIDALITTVGFSGNVATQGVLQTLEDIRSIPFDPKGIASQLDELRRQQAKRPLWVGELYPGHADFVGSQGHYVGDSGNFSASLAYLLQQNVSVTTYMGGGGSNFGTAGSMLFGKNGSVFSKSVTQSYDFDAPVTEAGDPHPQKFAAVRSVLSPRDAEEPVPAALPKAALGRVSLQRTTSLLSLKGEHINVITAASPQTFEDLGLGFGLVLYTNKNEFAGDVLLNLTALRDRGSIFLNGELQGTLGSWRPVQPSGQAPLGVDGVDADANTLSRAVGAQSAFGEGSSAFDPAAVVILRSNVTKSTSQKISILVENLGRPCDYGSLRFGLDVGWRGIGGPVTLHQLNHTQRPFSSATASGNEPWTMSIINFAELALQNSSYFGSQCDTRSKYHDEITADGWVPSLYSAEFTVPPGPGASAGSFLRIESSVWGSGLAAVNGWVLGRFEAVSAQRTFYVPRTVLRAGANRILLAETIAPGTSAGIAGGGSCRAVSFVEKPDLGQPVPL